jgi:hypothetical protein
MTLMTAGVRAEARGTVFRRQDEKYHQLVGLTGKTRPMLHRNTPLPRCPAAR